MVKPLHQTLLVHILDAATAGTGVIQRRVIFPCHSTDPAHILLLIICIPFSHGRSPPLHVLFHGHIYLSMHARHTRLLIPLHPMKREEKSVAMELGFGENG
jgi:hypothetical protein